MLAESISSENYVGAGGIVALAITMFVKDWFTDRKSGRRENIKVEELSAQTNLLRELVDVQKRGKKKSKEQHKQTQALVRKVLANQENNKTNT